MNKKREKQVSYVNENKIDIYSKKSFNRKEKYLIILKELRKKDDSPPDGSNVLTKI